MRSLDARRSTARALRGALAALALLACATSSAAQHAPPAGAPRFDPRLVEALAAASPASFVPGYAVMSAQLSAEDLAPVTRGLTPRARRPAVAAALKEHATQSQLAVRALLAAGEARGQVRNVRVLWIGNAVIFEAQPAIYARLARLSGIDRVRLVAALTAAEQQDVAPVPAAVPAALAPPPAALAPPFPPVEPNIVQLQAPQLWDIGHTGQGILIGNIDSGIWWTHPDLVNRIWSNPGETLNGLDDDGNGFVDDLRGWDFATNNNDITATDPHGTSVAGIAVGDGGGGIRTTGMAPGATMLGCQIGTEAHYWLAQQYCLDVGVDVITSSYSYKWPNTPDYHLHRQICAMELAAGIIHANSIGNQGLITISYPIPFNVATPGNCPSPFDHPALVDGGRTSVLACGGIVLPDDSLYSQSGLGPSAWEDLLLYKPSYPFTQDPAFWDYPYGGFAGGQPGLIKPDLMAYALNVVTASIGTGYSFNFGGTSAATPHVGGALALLRQVQPEALPRHLAGALELTAVDLGAPGKDNVYGAGKVAAFDAARRLLLLNRVDDQSPSIGAPFTLEVFGRPNALTYGWFSPAIADAPDHFNMVAPFFAFGFLPLDATGHAAVPLVIPNNPIFMGVTVWFQFGAQIHDPVAWGPGPVFAVPESITIGP